jgi:DNA invertase Pin-like site-specific DNA recombinase
MSALPSAPPETVRLAFLARVSTADQQDPTLSIPRQLTSCKDALRGAPFPARIVAHFYDVESGRKELDERGLGNAHERFDIPVPRTGGFHDLLAEAQSPGRSFDAVICESVERIARRTYYGTKVEHDLEQVGVPLLSAEEPLTTGRRSANLVLLRRMKQGVAEWYVLNILEQSWKGTRVHTEQGWNIGSPPYGFTGEKVPHPVPAKRAEGMTKTRLVIDLERAPVVRRIFDMRVVERLGCRAIAARLNADRVSNPPPARCDSSAGHGAWSIEAVRAILRNPKYTGYMVWNRRARNTRKGKPNPREEWVWSPQPTHEAIVSMDVWEAAQTSTERAGSRPEAGPNLAHPQTIRSYPLRSYVHCAGCGRRMTGKVRNGTPYYHCRPDNSLPGVRRVADDHPACIYVRQDGLLDVLTEFFQTRLFGAERRSLLVTEAAVVDGQAVAEREARMAAVGRAVAETDTKMDRLARQLADHDDPEGLVFERVQRMLSELERERRGAADELAALEATADRAPGQDASLLDRLPVLARLDVGSLPESTLRQLFDAFRLEVRYDRTTNEALVTATLDGDTADAVRSLGDDVLPFPVERAQGGASDGGPATIVPMLGVPGGGSTPTPAFAAGVRPNASVPPVAHNLRQAS